jgi:O-antigen ligase
MFALVSTLWSSDPGFTLRRSLVLIATTIFGIYFGSRYELPRQVRLLAWTFLILAVLSAACALLLPQYGIDKQLHQGDWQGILGQKNLLGKAMAVAILVLWSAKGVLPRVVRIAGLSLCAVLMLMSGSMTPLLVAAIVLLLASGHRALRTSLATLIPLALLLLAAGAGALFLAAGNRSLLLASLGRDVTLTRRTQIWSAVWTAISSHIAFGYGFSGFWEGIYGESSRVVATLGFVPRHAHNGFLDLWLELGIAGLFLFVAGYLPAVGNAVKLVRITQNRLATWPLQYLAFLLLYDMVEGPILRQNNLYWALYAAIVVSSAQAARCMHLLEHLEQQPRDLPRRTPGCLGEFHPEPGRSPA